jgi:hypothetical protein
MQRCAACAPKGHLNMLSYASSARGQLCLLKPHACQDDAPSLAHSNRVGGRCFIPP